MVAEHSKRDKRVFVDPAGNLVTVWLNITAWLIMPTEQGERLFRDDVRSTIRDQTNRVPHYALRRRTQDGRREKSWERESHTNKPRYAVVTCPLAYSFVELTFLVSFEQLYFLCTKYNFLHYMTIYYRYNVCSVTVYYDMFFNSKISI